MHDSNGTKLKVGDRVTVEFEVAEDVGYCNVRLAGVKHDERANGNTPMHNEQTTCTKFLTLVRRLAVPILLLAILATFASCSNLTAGMGYAPVLGQHVQQITANASAIDETAALKANAAAFDADYATSTANPFEWLFAGKKLLCGPAYQFPMRNAVLADRLAGMPLDNPTLALQMEAQAANCVLAEMLGQTAAIYTPPAVVKAARLKAMRLKATPTPLWLTQIIGKLPSKSQAAATAWIDAYGPWLIQQGEARAKAAIDAWLAGDQHTAYVAVVAAMTEAEIDAEFASQDQAAIAEASSNATAVQEAKNAANAIITALFTALMGIGI